MHIYDFQKLYLQFECQRGHASEVRAVHFYGSPPFLISGDVAGTVFIWPAVGVGYWTTPLMQLVAPTVSCITSICSSHDHVHASLLSPGAIYASCDDGRIHVWEMRAILLAARKNNIDSRLARFEQSVSPTRRDGYNALLRMTHKASVLKLHKHDREPGFTKLGRTTGEGNSGRIQEEDGDALLRLNLLSNDRHRHEPEFVNNAAIVTCAATKSWLAHDDNVFAVFSVPEPGLLCSFSQDRSIKIWDPTWACIGQISMLMMAPAKATTSDGGESTTKAPAWKFTTHVLSDASEKHAKLANDVIRKFKRLKQKRDLEVDTSGAIFEERPLTPFVAASSSPFATLTMPASRLSSSPDKWKAMYGVLTSQLPFSHESLSSGVQQGLFGPSEARQLRAMADNPALTITLKKPATMLTPLAFLPDESVARGSDKRCSTAQLDTAVDHDDALNDIMRTMKNYPLEVHRRRNTHSSGLRTLDISPSKFLQDKLSREGSSSPFKASSPKMRTTGNGSSSPLRSRALPPMRSPMTMPDKPHEEDIMIQATPATRDSMQYRVLRCSVSEPVLAPIESLAPQSERARSFGVDTAQQDEANNGGLLNRPQLVKRSSSRNIERKMKLYEDMHEDPNISNEESPSAAKRLHSQSHMEPPRTTATSPGSPTRGKRGSHGAISVAHSTSGSNPFGPHYTIKHVMEFGNMMTRFDEDLSGDLDRQEWLRMVQSFRTSIGGTDFAAAERLFHAIDTDDSGKISLHEILPTIVCCALSVIIAVPH